MNRQVICCRKSARLHRLHLTFLLRFAVWEEPGFSGVFSKPGDEEIITVGWARCTVRRRDRCMTSDNLSTCTAVWGRVKGHMD